MAYKITEDCTTCGACEPECPNNAISSGDPVYVINADLCTECVGSFDTPQCASVCPVEAPKADEDKQETEAQLLERAKKIHPGKNFSGNIPSHFRK